MSATSEPMTVLLVEDSASVRLLARRILLTAGFVVLEAENADVAVRVAARHGRRIHLLITDAEMPGEGGYALAKRLRTTWQSDLKVLIVSGYPQDAIEQEEVAFLQKPFSPQSLLTAAKGIMGLAG